MSSPARAAFLTRAPAGARIDATQGLGKRVGTGTAFAITFDRPVKATSVIGSIHLEPAATGTVESSLDLDGQPRYLFTPTSPLKANTQYRIVVDGAMDGEGVAVEPASLEIRTVGLAGVVRFRPQTTPEPWHAMPSSRSASPGPMDRATTKAAFKVTVDGKAIAGKVSFAEGDTVLVFKPAKALPYGTKVVMRSARPR